MSTIAINVHINHTICSVETDWSDRLGLALGTFANLDKLFADAISTAKGGDTWRQLGGVI